MCSVENSDNVEVKKVSAQLLSTVENTIVKEKDLQKYHDQGEEDLLYHREAFRCYKTVPPTLHLLLVRSDRNSV